MLRGEVVQRLVYRDPVTGQPYARPEDSPFYRKQVRQVLEHCGHIDPERVEEYVALGGYQALAQALTMAPEQVCQVVSAAGLRGRGGAGFPTGRKWEIARQQPSAVKYIVCNGDEGDPGAFMNRSLLEGDPHRVLEGMAIAGYAIGAGQGVFYVRAEYPLAVRRIRKAIADAERAGLLGDNIFGSGFTFHAQIREGAGAFVCGEESALLASAEGQRGMPRPRPPFPAVSGLNGKPTIINNVETLGNLPGILANGPDWFKARGSKNSPGTKTFALTGKVMHTGLVEIPLGATLREMVYDIGGGIPNGKRLKAVQIGGPSGGCLTEEHLDASARLDACSPWAPWSARAGWWSSTKTIASSKWPVSSCSSSRTSRVASAWPAVRGPSRCWPCSRRSSTARQPRQIWICWRKWPPWSKARCAGWARRRPIRC